MPVPRVFIAQGANITGDIHTLREGNKLKKVWVTVDVNFGTFGHYTEIDVYPSLPVEMIENLETIFCRIDTLVKNQYETEMI